MSTRLIALFLLITLVAQVTGFASEPDAAAEERRSALNSDNNREKRAVAKGIVEYCKARPDKCLPKPRRQRLPPLPPPG